MKKTGLLGAMAWFFLASCSSEIKVENQQNFKTFHPVVKDTLHYREYIAEIHALQNVEVRSRVHGVIEKIHVDEGQTVKKGQPLFTVANSSFQQDLIKAQAMHRSALTELKAVEIELQNTKRLADRNIVSATELEILKAKLEVTKAKIEEAKASETQAKLNLSFAEIRAPFDGIINRIPNKVGSLVDAETLLTTISNDREVFAYFNVSEIDYLDYVQNRSQQQGDGITLVLANGQVYDQKGKIETSESEFNSGTGNIAFRARFANPNEILKHGGSGKIRIDTELKNVLMIPQKATFEIQDNLYVYVVDQDNTVKMRRIVPKLRMENVYAVETGLDVKDQVIYEGIQLVKEGEKITAEKINTEQAFSSIN